MTLNAISRTKQYKCATCRKSYTKTRVGQKVCSTDCALSLAKSTGAKQAKRAAIVEKRETRLKLASMATKPQLIKAAQISFNAFIRTRDAGKPCICCGEPLSLKNGATHGGEFDCGHYLSVGARPHLRFHEDNAHGQRKYCNAYKAGNAAAYRVGLIARIGLERVESLESDNEPRKYTHDDLRAMAVGYRAKARDLIKQRNKP